MAHGGLGALANEVALHFSDASHDGEEETAHSGGGIDGLAAKIYQTEIHFQFIPPFGDGQAVGGVTKESIELEGNDSSNLFLTCEFEQLPSAVASLQRLPSRDTWV